MALARDKAHDSIKISDGGKAYLPDENGSGGGKILPKILARRSRMLAFPLDLSETHSDNK